MDNLDINLKKNIFDFIPYVNKKYCNKQTYFCYLEYVLPKNKYDWISRLESTVYGEDFRGYIHNMFIFILKNNLSNWFIEFHPDNEKGYMFTKNENINIISEGVADDGHSGATFSYCLRIMQDIFYNNNINKWLKPLNERLINK